MYKMKDKKNKTEEHKQRFALTLLFSFVVFCILVITVLIVNVIVFVLAQFGFFANDQMDISVVELIMLLITGASLAIGTLISVLMGKFPLKPFNTMINGLNRLAKGDYKARIKFGKLIRRHPAMTELTNSFNTLAEELENTEMLRSDFINNFSHEFKTPIVSIAGFAKLLKRGKLDPQQQMEYLNVIEEESLRLADMATNVLNMTKVENQAILSNVTKFNLSEQLRACVLLLERKWTKKSIEFSMDFGEHLIEGDEELLKQIWLNLVDNAVKFSPEGGLVEIAIQDAEEVVRVSVINNGPEIKPDVQKRIFDKFYQAEESHSTEGSGIGLAVVKRIVELHAGTVSVHSENQLNLFMVELPKKKR